MVSGKEIPTPPYQHCKALATILKIACDRLPAVPMPTQSARLFASLHIVVSVSWLAAFLGSLNTLSAIRKSQLARAALITSPPDQTQVMALDHDGQGVDELEFVVGMLISAHACSPRARPAWPLPDIPLAQLLAVRRSLGRRALWAASDMGGREAIPGTV